MVIQNFNLKSHSSLIRRENFIYSTEISKSNNALINVMIENDEIIGYYIGEYIKKCSLIKIIIKDYGEEENNEVYDEVKSLNSNKYFFLRVFEIAKNKQNKGYGKTLYNHLRKEVSSEIVLQSVFETELFWEKLGFEELIAYYKISKGDF